MAERVEKATGPDRVLDAEIHMAIRGHTIHDETDPATGHFAFWETINGKRHCVNCSSWTSPTGSLDEAMTLVPDGWSGELHFGPFGNEVSLMNLNGKFRAAHHTPLCATPALALTAACLKARATGAEE